MHQATGGILGPADIPHPQPWRGKNDLVLTEGPHPAERCVHASESQVTQVGICPQEPCRSDLALAAPPGGTGAGRH